MTDSEILELVKQFAPHWCDRCAIFHGYKKNGMVVCPVCEYDENYRNFHHNLHLVKIELQSLKNPARHQ